MPMASTRKPMPCRKPSMSKKHQPRRAGNLVEADGAEHEAEADREDGLGNVVAAQPDEGGEGQQHQREDLGRAEGQGNSASSGAKA
jgi:hypothetical protein